MTVRIAAAGAIALALALGLTTAALAETDSPARKPAGKPGLRTNQPAVQAAAKSAGVPTGKFRAAAADGITNRYVVVLKDGKATEAQVGTAARGLTAAHRGAVGQVYASSLRGFTATLTEADARQLALDPAVDFVEQDHVVRKADETQPTVSPETGYNRWALDRIDQAYLPYDHAYVHPAGWTVNVYVLDTGVDLSNPEFATNPNSGQKGWSTTWSDQQRAGCGGTADGRDDHGHGTFVAAEIAGHSYGVAKDAAIHNLKVLDCNGEGTVSGIVEGINRVAATAVKPAVANMSISGANSTAVDNAVKAAIATGVTFVVAAGNSNANACTASPADVAEAITVGATDVTDFRASFSNNGPCVDIFAPGVNIESVALPNQRMSKFASGTSMAAPLVTGAAALLLHAHPQWLPSSIHTSIVSTALAGTVHGAGVRTTTRLLRIGEPGHPSTGALRARANNRVVSPGDGTQPLIANQFTVGDGQSLDLVPLGSAQVALRSRQTGKYVAAEAAGAGPLVANRPSVGDWEKFTLLKLPDGSYSLQAVVNGRYVTADNGGNAPLVANRTEIGPWEQFDLVGPAASVFLSAGANQKIVSAEARGGAPLIANRDAVGDWEQFDVVDAGDGYAALYAHANGRYVTAENGGNAPLIANRTAVGDWEKFTIVNGNGYVAFQARANGRYVTTENGGQAPLIANRGSVGGTWELFELYTTDEVLS